MSSNQDAQAFNWRFETDLDDQNIEIRGRKLVFIVAIFFIILAFTALFLCARTIFRRHRRDLIHSPSQAASTPSQGLDSGAINKLPIILHQTKDPNNRALEETECCICLSAFRDGEKLKMLPGCDHCFHCECVDEWLANHSSCPLCRASPKLDPSFPEILIQEPPIRYHHLAL